MSNSDLDDVKRRMDGALESLKRDFAGLRTGRPRQVCWSQLPLKPMAQLCH